MKHIILASSFLAFFLGFNVQAATTTTTTTPRVIVTPAPDPKEVVVIPEGYTHCFTVAAGWYQNTWVPEHQVCQYAQSSEGVAWVQGYWSCNQYNANNDCTNWVWKSGRWVKTLEVY